MRRVVMALRWNRPSAVDGWHCWATSAWQLDSTTSLTGFQYPRQPSQSIRKCQKGCNYWLVLLCIIYIHIYPYIPFVHRFRPYFMKNTRHSIASVYRCAQHSCLQPTGSTWLFHPLVYTLSLDSMSANKWRAPTFLFISYRHSSIVSSFFCVCLSTDSDCWYLAEWARAILSNRHSRNSLTTKRPKISTQYKMQTPSRVFKWDPFAMMSGHFSRQSSDYWRDTQPWPFRHCCAFTRHSSSIFE